MGFTFDFKKDIQDFMESMGVPARDDTEMADSPLRFPDGAHFRNEISSIERPSTLKAMLDEAKKCKVNIHRIEYDIEQAAKKIIDAGMPEILAERLFHGR